MSDEWSDATRVVAVSDCVKRVLEESELEVQDQLLACICVFAQHVQTKRLTRGALIRMLDIVLACLESVIELGGAKGGTA